MAKKTILKALRENQKKLTDLDVNYLMGKIKRDNYKLKRELLRRNVMKIVKDKNLIDPLKHKNLI